MKAKNKSRQPAKAKAFPNINEQIEAMANEIGRYAAIGCDHADLARLARKLHARELLAAELAELAMSILDQAALLPKKQAHIFLSLAKRLEKISHKA